MKKLSVVAVAVCAFVGSAFAAWDYFPPKEAGKGQARLNFEYGIEDKISNIGIAVKGRYSIIEGLEAALSLPIPLSSSYDGTSAEGYAGLSIPAIGVRYWLPMGLGFYLDFGLPVDTRYDKDDLSKVGYEPTMSLGVGAQFSTKFTEELSLGSQLGLNVPFAGSDSKYADGMGLVIGAELDYSVGSLTPFLGAEASLGLTKPKFDGEEIPNSEADPFGIDVWVGAAYSINDMFGVDLSAKFGFSDKYKTLPTFDPVTFAVIEGESYIPITIGFNFDFNF